MNSSGIKRGLAVSAVSALAVAGIPALATSASAVAGDVIQVGSVGPTLNGGGEGGVVVLKTKNITEAEAEGDPAAAATPALKLVNTALTGSPNNASQSVAIEGLPVFAAEGSAEDSNKTDGFDEVTVHVSATTPLAGNTANYAIFLDDSDDGTVDAAEARAQVSQTTSGPVSKIDVSPASQSTPQNIDSGAYKVTLEDADGRTTQLDTGEAVDFTPPATTSVSESGNSMTAAELELGTRNFTATGTTVGTYNIALASTTTPVVNATATLNVTKTATLDATMVDIVTGADSWDGFNGGNFGAPNTVVRVDQGTIKIDVKGGAGNANSTVSLNVAGGGITFGGQASTTVATVLDASGNGSLTITPDAGTIQVNDTIALTGAFAETLQFVRGTATSIVPTAGTYFSKVGGTVDVTVKVVDQFGLPVTSGFVTAARDDENAAADTTPQKKAVGADGTVTFTFTDTKAVNGDTENVDAKYYQDEFTPVGSPDVTANDVAIIKYTTDGMGANYAASLDGTNTEGADYDATDVVVVPLADTVADDEAPAINESAALNLVTGGEPNSSMTISVDNDALILGPGQTLLSQGKSSVTVTLTAGGALPGAADDYRIVGTKSGVVTVTMSAANRTETAAFTVAPETDRTTARNVTVSGPAEVEHGTTQIPFVAVVTDGFGNPVQGVPVSDLNIQVTGPALFQDSDALTDANGQIHLNVRVDADAEGDVTIKVQGMNEQFGAAADQLTASSAANSGKGLPASAAEATATTAVAAAPVEPEQVDPQLVVRGRGGKVDRVKGNAISKAAGARATLWKNGKKVRSGVLNDNGNITFRIKDRNGNKKTRYVVKIGATTLTFADQASKRIR